MKGLGIVAVLASVGLGIALVRSRTAVLYAYEYEKPESMTKSCWKLQGATVDKDSSPLGLHHRSPSVDPLPAGVYPGAGDTLDRVHIRHAWVRLSFDHYLFRRPDHSGMEWFRGRVVYFVVLGALAAAPLGVWLLFVAVLSGRKKGAAA